MKIKILDNKTRYNWDKYLPEIQSKMQKFNLQFDVEAIDVRPPTENYGEYNGRDLYGIEKKWYDTNITPKGNGYDFVFYVEKDWQQHYNDLMAWGWHKPTRNTQGAIRLQVGCPERVFVETFCHELLHALFFTQNKLDTVHYWIAQGDMFKCLDELHEMDFKYLCEHHTAVKRTSTPQLYAVNKYHKEKNWGTEEHPYYQTSPSKRGWYITYNEFVDVNGLRVKTRLKGERTIAVRGHNCGDSKCDTYHVCYACGNEPLNEAQERTRNQILNEQSHLTVVRHRDLDKTRTCPGDYIGRIKPDIKEVPSKEDLLKQEIRTLQLQVIDLARQLIARLLKQL